MNPQRAKAAMPRYTTFGLYSLSAHWATRVVDRGWFGLTPLERHIVICGCPRGGTTLLHLMLTVALQARTFGREQRATYAAKCALRNHATLLTKRPNDIFELDKIRDVYRNRQARPLFLINMRDPRDVLVSKHSKSSSEYYVSLERWQQIFTAINACKEDDDVLYVRFERLVGEPETVGEEISSFTSAPLTSSMRSYYTSVPTNFEASALNGVRHLDTNAIGRWRQDQHRDRIKRLLSTMPEIVDQLISWDYETNDQWAQEFRS